MWVCWVANNTNIWTEVSGRWWWTIFAESWWSRTKWWRVADNTYITSEVSRWWSMFAAESARCRWSRMVYKLWCSNTRVRFTEWWRLWASRWHWIDNRGHWCGFDFSESRFGVNWLTTSKGGNNNWGSSLLRNSWNMVWILRTCSSWCWENWHSNRQLLYALTTNWWERWTTWWIGYDWCNWNCRSTFGKSWLSEMFACRRCCVDWNIRGCIWLNNLWNDKS